VLARWGRLLAEIRRPMSDRMFELVTFAAALELRNPACSLAHGKQLAAFFSYEEISDMAAGKYGPSLTDAERAMMKFARRVARDATSIGAGDVENLREHGFADAEIFDIVATAAGRAFFTKILDGLGVELDASFSKLDPSFRESVAAVTRSTE
jgi:alkylhydroperoxidase family enzyme